MERNVLSLYTDQGELVLSVSGKRLGSAHLITIFEAARLQKDEGRISQDSFVSTYEILLGMTNNEFERLLLAKHAAHSHGY